MIGTLLKWGGYALMAREAADLLASNQYYREREMSRQQTAGTVSGTLVGLAVGVGVGILFAPRAGRETREMLGEAACERMDMLQTALSEKTREMGECLSQQHGGEEKDQAKPEEAASK